MLGRRLNEANTIRSVAEVTVAAADELMGWDSCALDLWFPESDTTRYVLAMDLIESHRAETIPENQATKPSPKFRQVIRDGPQMILRGATAQGTPEFMPFGDKARLSASLLFVPIRYQTCVTGVLTIQKYATYAYTEDDLNTLLALADHCGGAIERIQAEARLHRTEELYRRAIGGAGAVPYVYDYRTKKYSFMGEGIEQMTGYTPEEITPELWAAIINESSMAGEAAGLDKQEAARRVLAGEIRHWRCDMRITTRDGKSRWISDASIQNLDEAGRPASSMGILEDVTERKSVEQSLHRERTMLRTLVDILPDSVYVKDTAGRKTLANPADVRNTGRQTEAEVLGKTDFDLFPRETADRFVADDQVVLQSGQPVLNREESFLDAAGRRALVADFQNAPSRRARTDHRADRHRTRHYRAQAGRRGPPPVRIPVPPGLGQLGGWHAADEPRWHHVARERRLLPHGSKAEERTGGTASHRRPHRGQRRLRPEQLSEAS